MIKYYTIPEIPPSINRFVGRSAQWQYREQKQHWATLMAVHCRPRPAVPLERATVKITYYFPTRGRRDPDNYLKFLLDGLVRCGIIKDDCFGCIDLVLVGAHDKLRPRVEVTVESREGLP